MDEYHLFVNPIIVGGGKAALPADVRLPLDLIDERRFADGVVHLHYRPRAMLRSPSVWWSHVGEFGLDGLRQGLTYGSHDD